MILDLTKVSPRLLDTLLPLIKLEAIRNASEIELVLKEYTVDGAAKIEMDGWGKAARDLVSSIKDQKQTKLNK